jgi:hypothetical protein
MWQRWLEDVAGGCGERKWRSGAQKGIVEGKCREEV